MRVLVSILFSVVALFAEDPQALLPAAQVPDNLSIPAQLNKTINTKKCKAGDRVELQTLEPVLISNGLVMPEHAKLHGTIVGAASRQNDKPSWLLLQVDRAEWKRHSIALRAFIASQITLKPNQSGRNATSATNLSDFHNGRYAPSVPSTTPSGRIRSIGRAPRDATEAGEVTPQMSQPRLEDVYIQQASNGALLLLSPKPYLKLPSGTMFMLRNHPAASSLADSTTRKASAGPQH